MQRTSTQHTSEGKGNAGMFVEREPNICAAGVPFAQAGETVADCLSSYLLEDEVRALIGDSIKPDPKPLKLPPLRHPPQKDMRNAGVYTEANQLVNPPVETKFQCLVEDLKNTVYSSYWKKNVGSVPDAVPNLPKGFDLGTTLGKKNPYHGRLYDIVMPKNPPCEKVAASRLAGYQTDRGYLKPAFNPDRIFGKRLNVDRGGKWVKCCMTDERVNLGLVNKHINNRQADFIIANQPQLGKSLEPCNNISSVPLGFSFGILKPPDNLPECLTSCELNPERIFFKQCLSHLNTLRKCLKNRFDASFYNAMYLKLKFLDKNKTGWIAKELVYEYCNRSYIRFNPLLLEPLLGVWNAFNGIEVEYRTFFNMLNHTIPTPDLPKIWDVPDKCLDFKTTYFEMVNPDQELGNPFRAGVPSGRYFDKDFPITPDRFCKADRIYLPQESDAKSCLSPSLFTLLGISHRDWYAKREPAVVRRVFEAAGENFTDELFETIWSSAKQDHSEGWVCYETFRRALDKVKNGANK